MTVSATGVFIDMTTGQVVTVQPEDGIQLVPAGGIIDSEAARVILYAEAAAPGSTAPPLPWPLVAYLEEYDARH